MVRFSILVIALLGLSLWAQDPSAKGKKRVIRIMPLGDSITEAYRGKASYRYWLWKRLQETPFRVDFVGSRKENYQGPPQYTDFDVDHEGHWGWRIDQVLPRLDAWLAAADPDVVLCHLGTNDLREPISQIMEELGLLIDKIRAERPDRILFLAQLIPVGTFPKVALVNQEIAKLAAAKDSAESPVILVDHYNGYDGVVYNYDGVHPNEIGEKHMAARWFEAMEPVLRGMNLPPD